MALTSFVQWMLGWEGRTPQEVLESIEWEPEGAKILRAEQDPLKAISSILFGKRY